MMTAWYDTRIDTKRRRVITTWGKRVTNQALMDYQNDVWSDPAVHGFDELIDYRALEIVEVTAAGLEGLAKVAAAMDDSTGPGRTAIVVNEGLDFGMSRMYKSLREVQRKGSRQFMPFHRLEDAQNWLDASA